MASGRIGNCTRGRVECGDPAHFADHAGFEEEIKKIDTGVDLIIDFVGRSYFTANLNLLRRDGTIVFLAFLSGPKLEPDTNIAQILYKRLTLKGSTLRSRTAEYQSDLLGRFEQHALGLIREGTMKVEVHEVSLDFSSRRRSAEGVGIPLDQGG
jgi:NADPH:quinone reductase-like Zn-dependent oxidoreductase